MQEGGEINVSASSTGRAGDIVVNVGQLMLMGGASISSDTFGTGRAGDIVVNVGQLMLMGGASISSDTLGAGHGGTVTITARETVTIAGQSNDDRPSRIVVRSLAPEAGDAGRLSITASTLALDGGSIIADTTGAGRAGDI